MKDWSVPELDKEMVRRMNAQYGLPVFTSMLLTIRGITEKEEIEKFLSQDSVLDDPLLIKDMDKAVSRIRRAIDNEEKICVYGDYDCDGVTSTAILFSYLESVFADVMFYIPDRNSEGYGMNKAAVDHLKEKNVDLIITVDNGISAIDEIDYAVSLGIDVVVTDHHKPLDILPNAAAVVDPHRVDETYSYRDYSGTGLALKLIYALEDNNYSIIENYSDLAAMGTVADIVPLTGENRKIVKNGLFALKNTERIGLSELIEKAGVSDISSGTIGFKLGPRINAAGRLGNPYDAVELFLTEDEAAASEKADVLCSLNSERQSIETDIFESINETIRKDPAITNNRIIVLSSPGWNAGVVGIVSSRVTEKYGKPSIIISEDGEVCKGSGRSVEGFSLFEAILECSDLLEKKGGHPMAVGFSIKKENIQKFIKRINDYADKLEYMPLYKINVDCRLNPGTIVLDMIDQLKRFEPFGSGNPEPIFGLVNMRLDKMSFVGGGKHLRMSVSRGNAHLTLMKFSVDEFPYREGDILDFAVNIKRNEYMGKESLSFYVKDIHISNSDIKKEMYELQDYEIYKKGIFIKKKHSKFPDRSEFAAVYRFIRNDRGECYTISSLHHRIGGDMGVFKLMIILDIMSELHFIQYHRDADMLYINICEVSGKTDLRSSEIYRKLEEEIRNA